VTTPMPFVVDGKKVMVYGLDPDRDARIISQLQPMLEISPKSVDGISISPRGISLSAMELVVEIHGCLTASQLRLLADAIDILE